MPRPYDPGFSWGENHGREQKVCSRGRLQDGVVSRRPVPLRPLAEGARDRKERHVREAATLALVALALFVLFFVIPLFAAAILEGY